MLPAGLPATTGWQPVLPKLFPGRNQVVPILRTTTDHGSRITDHSGVRVKGQGLGCGVGRTLWGGAGLGVGVGRTVAVGVAVGVTVGVAVAVAVGVTVAVAVAVGVGGGGEGVAVGVVSDWAGAWICTETGLPVLKNPMFAVLSCGGAVESNPKLYNVAKRMALAFGFCASVSQ